MANKTIIDYTTLLKGYFGKKDDVEALAEYDANTGVKNLHDVNGSEISGVYGVTVTRLSKGYKLESTMSGSWLHAYFSQKLEKNTDYILSCTVDYSSGLGAIYFYGKVTGGSNVEIAHLDNISASGDKTLSFNSGNYDEYQIYLSITGTPSATGNITFDNFMIRDASITDPTYQPYAEPNVELTQETTGLISNSFANGCVNLLPNNATSQVVNGITWTKNADGTITASGTPTARSYIQITGVTLQAGTYRLSGTPKGGNYSSTYGCGIESLSKFDSGDGVEFTLSSETTFSVIFSIRTGGSSPLNITFKPMITLADMPNSDYAHYVPYCKSNKELTEEQCISGVDPSFTSVQNTFTNSITWTAPTDGWYNVQVQINSTSVANKDIKISLDGSLVASHRTCAVQYERVHAFMPLKKGAVVTMAYTDTDVECRYTVNKFI